jgi:four helix bundle protein
LHISRGSLYELETVLNIAVMVDVLAEEDFNTVIELLDKSLKILNGLINYYQKAELK